MAWKIPQLGYGSKDVVGKSGNQNEILSVYGTRWKFSEEKAHKAVHNADKVEENRFALSIDPMSEELLRSMDTPALQTIAAGLGIARISSDKEELITHIRTRGTAVAENPPKSEGKNKGKA